MLSQFDLRLPVEQLHPPANYPDVIDDPVLSPFWYVSLPSDEVAVRLAQRLLLIKGIFELWGEGGSFDEMQVRLAVCHPMNIHAALLFNVYF